MSEDEVEEVVVPRPICAVLFPYRSDGGPRDQIANWIETRWRQLCPDFEVVRGEANGNAKFNRSAAINDAFRKCRPDTELLFVADLDTIFHSEQVERTIQTVMDGGTWGYAFRGYFNLTPTYSTDLLAKPPVRDYPLEDARFLHWGFENVSGLMAIRYDAFNELGGFDECFVGWGYEDLAFDVQARRKFGEPFRTENSYLLHLWHPSANDPEAALANRARYERKYTS